MTKITQITRYFETEQGIDTIIVDLNEEQFAKLRKDVQFITRDGGYVMNNGDIVQINK